MYIDNNTDIDFLLSRYEKDFTYDIHPVERQVSVNHSEARKELQRRGPKVLGHIGAHLFSVFPIGEFTKLNAKEHDIFLAWGYLLYGIIREHHIEDNPYPHSTFGEQNMDVWIAFCFRNAL